MAITLKEGDRVFITDQSHPWCGTAGNVVRFEEYGPGPAPLKWSGWRTKLDNGFETYVTPDQVMGPGRVTSMRITRRVVARPPDGGRASNKKKGRVGR